MKPPESFHCDVAELIPTVFDHQPTLNDVLERLGYPDDGVRGLYWGEESVKLHATLADKDLLVLYFTWEDESCSRLRKRDECDKAARR